jgi:signal recognition particle receptor subunit beta
MVAINYATREVTCKIVYYGPGLSGKTTNLIYIHKKIPSNTKGKLISLATEADRTLYFDFLPINIGTISGFAAKFQLYTVPGQVYYNATRKLVLRGVDGLVFVADSQADKMDENIESLNNMKENIKEYGYDFDDMPIVIQYNKCDLPNILPVSELESKLNTAGWASFQAEAVNGVGVFDTLKTIIRVVLEKTKKGSKSTVSQPATVDTKKSVDTPSRSDETKVETVPPAANRIPVTPPPAPTPGVKTHTETVPEHKAMARASADIVKPQGSPVVETKSGITPNKEVQKEPIRKPAYESVETENETYQPEPPSVDDTPGVSNDIVTSVADESQFPSSEGDDRPEVANKQAMENISAQPRPFPGNRRERRITVSDFLPASKEDKMEMPKDESDNDNDNKEQKSAAESNMPSPTMAPSSRLVKKKRGFFKRLFGIK